MTEFVVYEPHGPTRKGILLILRECLRTVSLKRDLLFYLVMRDFLSDYKRSFIGAGWVIISPVLAIASWVFINYTGVLHPGDLNIPYPIYVWIGTMIWGLFVGIYQSTSNLFFESISFGIDVKFHRQVLIVKQIILHVLHFGVGLILFEVVLTVCGITPSWKFIIFPLTLLPLVLLGAGLGLFFSVYSVVLPDSKKWVDYGMQLLMFVTPIVYSPGVENPVVRTIIQWNPLSYLVHWNRAALTGGAFEDPGGFFLASLVSAAIFLIGLRLVFLSEDKVIEKIY